MATIRVTHGIDDLTSDMLGIAKRAPRAFQGVVREGIKVGNQVAKDLARESAGSHGKLYPRAFSAQMNRGGGLFGNVYSGEYGPDRGMPQGNMEFEFGSRNQPPHLDLNKSADLIARPFADEALDAADGLFW